MALEHVTKVGAGAPSRDAEGTPARSGGVLREDHNLAHVPGDVIGIVLVSYIVCAVNRATLPPPPALDSEPLSN